MEYFSAVALEDLENCTIAVKSDDGVRKMKTYQDLRENLAVLILNVEPMDRMVSNIEFNEIKRFEIPKGKMVRCVRVNVG